ncbi:unnamed protein product, partial [Mesorhabditis spiculigera]
MSARKILESLVREFGTATSNESLTRKEATLRNWMAAQLREVEYSSLTCETEEEQFHDEMEEVDDDWDGADVGSHNNNCVLHDHIRFDDKMIPESEVKRALDYYRSAKNGHRTVRAMTTKFRWVTSDYHIRKLRKYASDKKAFCLQAARKQLIALLKKEVMSKFDDGIQLHDGDLATLAIRINNEVTRIPHFQASPTWIYGFKRYAGIVLRRITRIVSVKTFRNQSQVQQAAQKVVDKVRDDLKNGRSQKPNPDPCWRRLIRQRIQIVTQKYKQQQELPLALIKT